MKSPRIHGWSSEVYFSALLARADPARGRRLFYTVTFPQPSSRTRSSKGDDDGQCSKLRKRLRPSSCTGIAFTGPEGHASGTRLHATRYGVQLLPWEPSHTARSHRAYPATDRGEHQIVLRLPDDAQVFVVVRDQSTRVFQKANMGEET